MSLSVTQICSLARMRVGDSAHAKYSDYELVSACQAALDVLQMKLDAYFAPVLVASAELSLSDGSASLPSNFASVIAVHDKWHREIMPNYQSGPYTNEYRITDGCLKNSNCSELTLTYRKRLDRLSETAETALASSVSLPVEFMLPLAKMTAFALSGEFDAMASEAEAAAQNDKLRNFSNASDYQLFGGYFPKM